MNERADSRYVTKLDQVAPIRWHDSQETRDLAAQSPRFVTLWESGAFEPNQDFGRHKVIDHPDVGPIPSRSSSGTQHSLID